MTTSPSPAIVLVDDEPDMLAILHRLLRDLETGYDLIGVRDGAAALAQVAQRPVALLITDDHLPGMDGLAVISAVKAVAPRRPIMLLAAASAQVEGDARAAGADFYLSMPFPFDQFKAVIHAALAR